MFQRTLLFRPDDGDGTGAGDAGTGGDGDAGAGTGGDGSQEDIGTGAGTGDAGTSDDNPEASKARREAAKYRVELKAAKDKLKEFEDAGKTDLENAQQLVKDLQGQLGTVTEKAKKAIVATVSGDVGIVKEARSDAATLLDWSKIEDPLDEAEVAKALKDLVKERPYLLGKGTGGADGGAGGRQGAGAQSMNDRIREAAGRT